MIVEHVYTWPIETETGQVAMIDVTHDTVLDTFAVKLSGELLDESREGIVAAVQMAFLGMREHRAAGFAHALVGAPNVPPPA